MFVVTGATGNVGRPLVEALAKTGAQVTAVSRTEVPLGVRHVRADLTEPETLKPALDGAVALFLLTSPDFLAAGGDLGRVVEIARASGVRRVVLLSSQGVATGRHPAGLEEAVTASGLEWTLLRPGGFHSNTFGWAEMVRTRRTVAAPFGDVALPTVDPVDIAEVAAAAMRRDGHAGQVYTLTGPEPVSPRQQTAAIAEAVGEPVRFAELSRAEARAWMLQFMPESVAESTLDILGAPKPVEQQVSPDVERVLQRPARSFAEWALANVAVFK
ncbi:NmrA family transcriptional regulator [Amycolatopsis deserti]|uniref:NmrA family transcriptional regulator n=1 Tax=Amycolatopsis deserti TaxID=185696 RepID=A0ABQ3JDQ7_9PSEU|nr:NAD(P)H-binding protein [Amycolatopsis deserti]GHF08702.1 NmrA family transcriptional regulator [Amycolatopsis deserti]